MSQFCVPVENPVTAGDIISAVRGDLVSQYKDRGWYVGIAETNSDVVEMLRVTADGALIVLKWNGDDTAEASSPITRPVVLNLLSVIVKQRSAPTASPNQGIIQGIPGRESLLKSISDLRKRLLSYRFTQNNRFAFDDDQRGPVYSRLRFYGTKPLAIGNVQIDAFEMAWKFYSPADTPSMDDTDMTDKVSLELVNVGSKI